MKKDIFIDRVSELTGYSKQLCDKTYSSMLLVMKDILKNDGRFVLQGIGTIVIVDMPERMRYNPRINAKVLEKAHKTVRFLVSKSLPGILNPEEE